MSLYVRAEGDGDTDGEVAPDFGAAGADNVVDFVFVAEYILPVVFV